MPQQPRPFDQPVFVTRPLLPPLEGYIERLREIWASGWLANGGDQHQRLESALAGHLGSPHLSLFNNGTLGLIVACQALRLSGEVITTPFSFPATPHVLSWNAVTPVFADVEPGTMNIDPARIESLITGRTTGILGVHVYGTPCQVDAIDDLARNYGLKVIYDGAHAFGAQIDGRPIASFGDATMFSFHATKLFHTAEGGALAVRDAPTKQRIDLLKNFGIKNEHEVVLPGINGKMSELSAALGLEVLACVDAERAKRQRVADIYLSRLARHEGVVALRPPANVRDSLQYFVIRIDAQHTGVSRDQLHERLRTCNIVTRKYFYPLCSQYSCYRHLPSAQPDQLPVATRLSTQVLCLPFFGGLTDEDAHRICDAIDWGLGGPSH